MLEIHDITCRSPRSGPGPSRGGESLHVVFVRRGAFSAHLARREFLADPCTALISWPETEYRISHPADCGDDNTIVELDPQLGDELLRTLHPKQDIELRLSPRAQALHAVLATITTRAPLDTFAAEEAALELIHAAIEQSAPPPAPGKRRRKIAHAAIALLNTDLSTNRPVSMLAEEIGCSPSHLMHAFRAEAGTSLRAYRRKLRVARAFHFLAAGHDDLAALAAELGFASHAHLTGAFVELTGAPPTSTRKDLCTFLEARRRLS